MGNSTEKSNRAFREGVDWNWKEELWLSFDTEATGVSPSSARVFEVGLVVGNGRVGVTESMGFLINPGGPIPEEVEGLTGVTTEMVSKQRSFADHVPLLERFLFYTSPVLVGYNALSYDVPLLECEFRRAGLVDLSWPMVVDPLLLLRGLNKNLSSYRLGQVTLHYGVSLDDAHRAVDDARATLGVLSAISSLLPDGAGDLMALQKELGVQLQVEKERFDFWVREGEGGGMVMGKGKHVGLPLAEVDSGYFRWVLSRVDDLPGEVREIFGAEMERRKGKGR